MKSSEIASAAAAIGNQLKAGVPLYQVVRRMAQLQPKHADFWSRAAVAVQSGRPLSESLAAVWPQALVSAVKAGEHSGRLDEVFAKIEETLLLRQSLLGTVSKLAYPVGLGLAGLGVFFGFMVFVLPELSKSLNTASKSFIFELSSWMAQFFDLTALAIAGLCVAALAAWLSTKEARQMLLEMLFGVPVVKDALRDMYFGLWAHYVAMMTSAGIPTVEALKSTIEILPSALRESVRMFAQDLSVNNRLMSDAADPTKQAPDDPRVIWWPFYISNAFIIAEQTGMVDKELMRVAPALINEGVKTLNRVISLANVVALALAAFLIVSPLAAYYTEIFQAVRQAGR